MLLLSVVWSLSDSSIPPSEGVSSPRHPKYIIFLSLGSMPIVPTALHLAFAHIDDITKPITIYNDIYKFAAYPYSTLQEFAVDNKVTVTSHPEAVRKLHAWRTDFDKILKRSAAITYEVNTS